MRVLTSVTIWASAACSNGTVHSSRIELSM